MKEGWTYKKLGEVCDYSIGLTYKPTDICDNGTIVLRSSNIQNGQIDLNDIVRVSCPIKDTLFVNKGDILMCSRNGSARLVGKVAIIPDIKERMTYGTFMMIIRSDYNPFLFYYFNSDIFRKQIKHGEANMINQITRYMLDDVVVSLPPLSDQQRIVSRLDAAFSHIDELKANAEKRLSEARALFQKSLAKAMEPKEGWKEKKLIEITHDKCPISYGIVQQGDHIDGGIPVVRPVDMREKYITRENLKCTTQTISDSYKRTILRGDELLLSVRGTTGIISLATPELKGCNVNRGIVPLYFKDQINKDFLYYEMVSPLLQSVFAEKTTGSTLKQINIKDLRLIKLSLPPLSEQQRIVERLDALSAHVRELEEYQKKIITECDALKQALLRKVFE